MLFTLCLVNKTGAKRSHDLMFILDLTFTGRGHLFRSVTALGHCMPCLAENRIKQGRAWLLLGWVTAERSCPCKQPACPIIGGGSEVTFKPFDYRISTDSIVESRQIRLSNLGDRFSNPNLFCRLNGFGILRHITLLEKFKFSLNTITCDCEATPALQLKVFRQKGEKVEVSHYRVNVNRFRARLSIFCITEKLLADVKCDGWPDIKVSLAQVGAIKNNMDESQLQEVITEIVTVALRNTEVHFNLSQYPTCPRLNRYVPPPSHLLPVHYDSLLNSSHSMSINSKTADKRLLVKVVKAVGLGCKKGVQEPFCIVELDEPPQKNQTSLKKDTDSPVWDEHFLFDISGHTSEILFEVYDRAQGENKFLGLAIVGVEELLINPSQRQTISLQSRPYQEDTVSGMLTLEFLFIEGADLPQMGDKPFKLKETLKSVSPSGKTVTTTKTVFAKPGPTTEHLTNGGDGVTDSALRDLELRNKGPPTQTSKSTLIIHSVQRAINSSYSVWNRFLRSLFGVHTECVVAHCIALFLIVLCFPAPVGGTATAETIAEASFLLTFFGSLQMNMTPDFRSQVCNSVRSQMLHQEEGELEDNIHIKSTLVNV
ncbi:C2 domain-containing protein 2 [Homalodisca vitripennis]|nr:C2 domain-containing protein 2 [Homalodisca vitripennis]